MTIDCQLNISKYTTIPVHFLSARICLYKCWAQFKYCIHSCEHFMISVLVPHGLAYAVLGCLITVVDKCCKECHGLTGNLVLRVGEVSYDTPMCSSWLDVHKMILQRFYLFSMLTAMDYNSKLHKCKCCMLEASLVIHKHTCHFCQPYTWTHM